MVVTFLKGMGIGSGLIIAIGAQNAFVLSQGVKRNHHIVIPLICSLCDAILIMAGIFGLGQFVAESRILTRGAAIFGALFLFIYGFTSFRSAFKGGSLETVTNHSLSFRKVIAATFAVTLLNPHVYLDTIVLMGSISSQFKGSGQIWFGAGAITASFIWFFSLSLGGNLLAPLFKNPLAWKVLDTFVGITMWAIALSLLNQI